MRPSVFRVDRPSHSSKTEVILFETSHVIGGDSINTVQFLTIDYTPEPDNEYVLKPIRNGCFALANLCHL